MIQEVLRLNHAQNKVGMAKKSFPTFLTHFQSEKENVCSMPHYDSNLSVVTFHINNHVH